MTPATPHHTPRKRSRMRIGYEDVAAVCGEIFITLGWPDGGPFSVRPPTENSPYTDNARTRTLEIRKSNQLDNAACRMPWHDELEIVLLPTCLLSLPEAHRKDDSPQRVYD